MRFKIDENLPPESSALLQNNGHDAPTVWDQGLHGRPDAQIASVCQKERRALITLDLDFADILKQETVKPPILYTHVLDRDGKRVRSPVNGLIQGLSPSHL